MAKETGSANAHDPKAPQVKAPKVKQAERIYKNTQEVDHDLFKLKPASMKKNVSFTDEPRYEFFEHCHIFHTVDSNGKPQEACTPVGGHVHKIEVVHEGGVPALKVSPAMHWVRRKKGARFQRMLVPITETDPDGDDHTHASMYLGSERIKLRESSLEFAKFDAAMRAKENPTVEGVVEQ